MGMSTHVVGMRPPDKKWLEMKAAWEACEGAGVEIPERVLKFFGHVRPKEDGVIVSLDRTCCKVYNSENEEGYEIDVKKLPGDVTIIRFYNSF